MTDMGEMSLIEQIRAIDEMIDYIETTLPDDIRRINENMDDSVRLFRQNGRSDIADWIESPHMFFINEELGRLMDKLKYRDLDYLRRLRNDLYDTLNA